mmetsp:Transcript_2390/g.6471  ORF Transcript_2390/g.6471 Transcript_2390/m.6471 type:complete len:85 (-) Transcript_2390:460-714(-)
MFHAAHSRLEYFFCEQHITEKSDSQLCFHAETSARTTAHRRSDKVDKKAERSCLRKLLFSTRKSKSAADGKNSISISSETVTAI